MSEQTIVIDLAARYAAAFGTIALGNTFNAASVTKNNEDYDFELYGNADAEFEEVVLRHNQTELFFSGMLSGNIPGIFAPPMLIDFSREKDLIETKVNGSDNVIVERWGTKPWDIEFRGLLVDMENKTYPAGQIERLTEFFEINDIIEVEGARFEDKKILSLYFRSVRFTAVEGFPDTVQYVINASSIKPVGFDLLTP